VGSKQAVKIVIAHSFGLLAAIGPVQAIDVGDNFPERMVFYFAWRPFKFGADRD
jgi:hypothetical protein